MKEYEYKRIKGEGGTSEQIANREAENGWRCVSVWLSASGDRVSGY